MDSKKSDYFKSGKTKHSQPLSNPNKFLQVPLKHINFYNLPKLHITMGLKPLQTGLATDDFSKCMFVYSQQYPTVQDRE